MAQKKSNQQDAPSVISIIQEMLQKGESEDKIFATLKELGIKEEQIKNLLLISQADTYSLLKSEIAKYTQEKINEEMPKYKKELFDEVTKYNSQELIDIKDEILKDINSKQDAFEQKQDESLEKVTEFVETTKDFQEKQNEDIIRLDETMHEKMIGSTRSLKILRIIGFIVGLGLLGLTAYKFYTLGIGSSLDFVILYVLTLVAGITLLILSLL